MCSTCGCRDRTLPDGTTSTAVAGTQVHTPDHDRHHDHNVGPERRTVVVRQRVLAHNDGLAQELRERFEHHGVFVVNVVSSPGSGKTELLARTMAELGAHVRTAAVTGDLATENDADRLSKSGSPVRQILTGTMCHLEADMVVDAIEGWDLDDIDVLFIENVGNMVCPSGFDLGEDLRVMLVSTTEGEDKPLKYPTLTMSADVAVISKCDLAEAVECDVELLARNLDEVRPGLPVLRTSARSGAGLEVWMQLIRERATAKARSSVV
jgi:hydrogenase nickel incorporation protein HypB